ncbi:MAG: YHS domain-containing (seleno)protein [Roseibium sp.]
MSLNVTTLAIAILTLASMTNPSYAADEYNVTTGPTLAGAPLGVHGVDAVALSTFNIVAGGTADHTVVTDGVAYYFASAETAKMFEAAPERYLPQYGGFCAFAVTLGKKLDGDPRYADIVDGKLYLFVNEAIFAKYQENKAEILKKAADLWQSIEHKSVESL